MNSFISFIRSHSQVMTVREIACYEANVRLRTRLYISNTFDSHNFLIITNRYGLYFPDTNTNAVMYTDATGAATVRIAMPANMQSSLIFHYNLKFYDSDGDNYDGVSLKRFVMQVSELFVYVI